MAGSVHHDDSSAAADVAELKVSKPLAARFPELTTLVQLATCPVCYRYILVLKNTCYM